ncbi:tryptophan synthase subunit alpha, partial [Streptococcus pyogenes]
AGLDMAFLVAPNTSPTRLEDAIRASTAFVYVVPLYGVTGIRRRINNDAIPLLSNIRSTIAGRRPLGVGFGISSPAHVRRMARATDAII